MRSDASSEVAEVDDGRKAFDFLMGSWNVANRRLVDPLRESAGWREFSTVAVARPLLKGLGNTDSYDSADDSDFHGVTLRLFDPAACLWRIWWASTSRPGHLDPPMEGRFDGSRGVFHGTDTGTERLSASGSTGTSTARTAHAGASRSPRTRERTGS